MPVRRSDRVLVSNLKLIGYRSNSDGIDIANCRDVTVENCFIRSSDDLIVIKSDRKQGNVNHIVATGCVLWNQFAHALSIGAELREDINDVLFTDCDVIHDTGREWSLRVFHCDSSRVTNVRFDNIRIEESHKLISLWIGKSVWSLDKEQRGQIQGIVFKDINANGSPLTVDLVGFDDKHGIRDVLFQNVLLNNKYITLDDIQANSFVKNIIIKP
jgi:polygalacturonase